MTKLSQGSRAPAVRHQLPLESAEAAQLPALACAEKTNEMGRNLSLGLLSSSAKPSGGVCLKQTVAWSPLGALIVCACHCLATLAEGIPAFVFLGQVRLLCSSEPPFPVASLVIQPQLPAVKGALPPYLSYPYRPRTGELSFSPPGLVHTLGWLWQTGLACFLAWLPSA